MTPSGRALALAALWAVGTLLVVAWPALAPAAAGAAGVLLALAIADAWLLRREPVPTLVRALPERAFVGREHELRLELGGIPARPLEVDLHEAVPPDLRAAPPRFGRLRVPRAGTARARFEVQPTRRGDRPLGAPLALVRSPLGLLRRRVLGAPDDVLRVYPDTTHLLRPEALDPKRVLALLGVRPARQRGEGMEFESLRDYVAGDDPRRLDWAASARRGRPVVRQHRHERNHNVLIALDGSRLMAARLGGRSKLDFAVDAALALGYAALGSGDRVAMTVFDQGLRGFLAPRAGRRELGRFVEFLRPIEPRLVEADFEAFAREVALRQRQRALLVVLTDFVEADAAFAVGILSVLARHHRVLLVAVRDPLYAELDPRRRGPVDGLYRRIVLDDLLRDREVALATLRRRGLQTLDLPPDRITAPVLNRYLALRYGAAT
ncbi:MAG: DUF58 domain-containing protein [Myxococcota bacterium]|nr:DUF58 domain-containing protein [Myxococcota bacterium]